MKDWQAGTAGLEVEGTEVPPDVVKAVKVFEDGTIDISYDDGDHEEGVHLRLVRIAKRRKSQVTR